MNKLFLTRRPALSLCLLLLSLSLPMLASADYILTAPPRENAAEGAKIYGPLAAHLSALLGKKVSYQHPDSWTAYEKGMKKGDYDIIFDGSHFAAWRIHAIDAQPLVKLPGTMRFVLVSDANQAGILKTEDLVNKRICTLPSPHMGALALFSMYPNPVQQPNFVPIVGTPLHLVEAFEAGKCDGVILAKYIYVSKLSANIRSKMRLLQESKAIANQGITVSARVEQHDKELMMQSLTSDQGRSATAPILQRYAGKSDRFMPASVKDYDDQNLLRDNMIFGW